MYAAVILLLTIAAIFTITGRSVSVARGTTPYYILLFHRQKGEKKGASPLPQILDPPLKCTSHPSLEGMGIWEPDSGKKRKNINLAPSFDPAWCLVTAMACYAAAPCEM